MNKRPSTLLTDLGGVLLTNGWDRVMRRRAAETFGLDIEEMDERHHLTFDTYEQGRLGLDEYLDRVVFYRPRTFSHSDFRHFMFSQSSAHREMIELIKGLKSKYALTVAAVSNEGRELTQYRINAFNLAGFIDCFVCSCFVHCSKPDKEIFRMALDLVQADPETTVYIDDREMFAEVARDLGIMSVYHSGFESTRDQLASRGLALSA